MLTTHPDSTRLSILRAETAMAPSVHHACEPPINKKHPGQTSFSVPHSIL